jgi:hypothetical protein
MPDGVVYFFSGMGAAERLVVSIHSLRKVYRGPITVGVTGDPESELVAGIGAGVEQMRVPRRGHRNGHYVTKCKIPEWAPYEHNAYLDADTLVVKPIDRLFEAAREKKLAITQFSEWITTGPRMSGRIIGAAHKAEAERRHEWISGYIEACCQEQIRPKAAFSAELPGINTGVMSWQKGNPALALWHAVTMAVGYRFIADELAMQLISMEVDAEILSDAYNASPLYIENTKPEDVVIWHFHGRKHIKKEPALKLWGPAFEEARREKFGGIDQWAGWYDKEVRRYLKGLA